MNLLKTSCSISPIRKLISAWFSQDFPSLETALFGLKFKNPVGLGAGFDKNAAYLRESQTQSALHPKVGMVVVSDLVDNVKDIHPVEKQLVASRLANYALAETYGVKGLAYKSPVYASHQIEKGKIRVSFDNVPTVLISRGGAPTEFYVAGADNKFFPATAKIDGKTVVVSSKEVKDPVAVRFSFNNTAISNLFSAEGLPVNLFRTDK